MISPLWLLLSPSKRWSQNNEVWQSFTLPLNWSASEREGGCACHSRGPLVHAVQENSVTLHFLKTGCAFCVCFFLRQADYLHTYHGTPIEKIMTQKDQWYILRRATIFGFGMKPAVLRRAGGRPICMCVYLVYGPTTVRGCTSARARRSFFFFFVRSRFY